MHYILTDPIAVGVVAWVGLLATTLGLLVAIWQITRVQSATRAAGVAIKRLTTVIYSRERLLDLSFALRQLDSARHQITQRDYAKANIFLEFARNECVQVRELVANTPSFQRQMNSIVVRLTKLIEALEFDDAAGEQETTAVQRALEVREIANLTNATFAQLRYSHEDNGVSS